jgi:hypothetical protein
MYYVVDNRILRDTIVKVDRRPIMAKIRIIEYEGSDEQIMKILTQGEAPQIHSSLGGTNGNERNGGGVNPSIWEGIAKKFQKYVSETAAWGHVSQNKAMLAWLQHDGDIELTTLWKAAGVKSQHSFGGVGGSLTKNMKKAGGPREWYTYHRNEKDQWIYKIADELVGPLKGAFGVK